LIADPTARRRPTTMATAGQDDFRCFTLSLRLNLTRATHVGSGRRIVLPAGPIVNDPPDHRPKRIVLFCRPDGAKKPVRLWSQPRVDRLALQGEDRERAPVDRPTIPFCRAGRLGYNRGRTGGRPARPRAAVT
jgi:hypothetical protein